MTNASGATPEFRQPHPTHAGSARSARGPGLDTTSLANPGARSASSDSYRRFSTKAVLLICPIRFRSKIPAPAVWKAAGRCDVPTQYNSAIVTDYRSGRQREKPAPESLRIEVTNAAMQ